MENVLGNSDKVIIDSSAKGNNVIPYLPLDKLNKEPNLSRDKHNKGAN